MERGEGQCFIENSCFWRHFFIFIETEWKGNDYKTPFNNGELRVTKMNQMAKVRKCQFINAKDADLVSDETIQVANPPQLLLQAMNQPGEPWAKSKGELWKRLVDWSMTNGHIWKFINILQILFLWQMNPSLFTSLDKPGEHLSGWNNQKTVTPFLNTGTIGIKQIYPFVLKTQL